MQKRSSTLLIGTLLCGIVAGVAAVEGLAEDDQSLKQQAQQQYHAGGYQAAEALYRQAATLNDRDPELFLQLGRLELKRGHTQEAIGDLERARALAPTDPEIPALLGETLSLLGRHQEAAAAFEQALQLQPRRVDALEQLAASYARVGRMPDALKAYQRLAELDRENVYVSGYLGEAYLYEGRYEDAREQLQRAITRNPTFADTYASLASLEAHLGNSQDAIRHLERAIALRPGDPALHSQLGAIYVERKEYDKALEPLSTALELNPEDRYARQYHELAQRMVERAARGQPASLEPSGDPFEGLLRLYPDNPPTLASLAYLYDLSNEWEKAMVLYNRLLTLNPRDAWAKEGLERVAKGMAAMGGIPGLWDDAPEVETTHFIIKTNLPVKLAGDVIRRSDGLYERAAAIIAQVTGQALEPQGAPKIRLQVFARSNEFLRYVAMRPLLLEALPDAGGFFDVSQNEIVYWLGPEDRFEGLAHEFAHAALWRAGKRQLPEWLDEGLAEYVVMQLQGPSYFSQEEDGQGARWLQTLREASKGQNTISLDSLVRDDLGYSAALYAGGWSLVSWLIDRAGEQPEAGLRAYFRQLRLESDASQAFRQVYGDPGALERDWKQFVIAVNKQPKLRQRLFRRYPASAEPEATHAGD